MDERNTMGEDNSLAGQNSGEDRSEWRPFIERACAAVGVDPATVDEDEVLDLTRVIAHDGERPMAPVAAYILGLSVGAGGDAAAGKAAIEGTVSPE